MCHEEHKSYLDPRAAMIEYRDHYVFHQEEVPS
jgi:hypothetical protein